MLGLNVFCIVTRNGEQTTADLAPRLTSVPRFTLYVMLLCLYIFLPQGPTSLVSPLLVCMQDKSAGARQVAQECLSVLIGAGTVQPSRVRAETRDFPPAVMRQLKPALEKILEASGMMTTTADVGWCV